MVGGAPDSARQLHFHPRPASTSPLAAIEPMHQVFIPSFLDQPSSVGSSESLLGYRKRPIPGTRSIALPNS